LVNNSHGSEHITDYTGHPGTESIAGDSHCYVKIAVVKLRGLRSGALFGQANPYITFTLGSQREKTSVKWGGKDDWYWKDPNILFRASSAKIQTYKLYIKVYDKERIRRKRLLGAVAVKLSGLEVNGIDSWFALEGGDTGSNGDVFLSIQLANSEII
jgi:Ca2+-dependent lipid-binding protein